MDLPVTTEQMAEAVSLAAAEATPLARVATAVQASSELSALGDAVLDRFVRAARESGCSWAEIGTALGVTRQAAHVRFNDRAVKSEQPWPQDFSDQAREVIAQAAERARELGHNYVGTEHVLLALLGQENDVAAQVLRKLGLTTDAVRGHAKRIVGVCEPRKWDAVGVAPRLKKALELAHEHAKRLGHRCAGTEHLLLGLVDVEGVAAQILSEEGITTDQLRTQLGAALGVDVSQLTVRRRHAAGLRRARTRG